MFSRRWSEGRSAERLRVEEETPEKSDTNGVWSFVELRGMWELVRRSKTD